MLHDWRWWWCVINCAFVHWSQALLGLGHIHSRKIIHRDIKSLNLFLDKADSIKVVLYLTGEVVCRITSVSANCCLFACDAFALSTHTQ